MTGEHVGKRETTNDPRKLCKHTTTKRVDIAFYSYCYRLTIDRFLLIKVDNMMAPVKENFK